MDFTHGHTALEGTETVTLDLGGNIPPITVTGALRRARNFKEIMSGPAGDFTVFELPGVLLEGKAPNPGATITDAANKEWSIQGPTHDHIIDVWVCPCQRNYTA